MTELRSAPLSVEPREEMKALVRAEVAAALAEKEVALGQRIAVVARVPVRRRG